jgi:sporulation protein YlmC with PRC-barrel domain
MSLFDSSDFHFWFIYPRSTIMKNKFKMQLVTAAVVSVFGAAAFAQNSNLASSDASSATAVPGANTQVQSQRQVPSDGRDMRISKLLGKDVKNARGENLGEIEDVIIDPVAQRVHYAVLSFGGFLGTGDKLFAFPVSAFTPSADRDELILNVDKDRLENAPGFERANWPNWNRDRYRAEVDRYFQANSPGGVAAGARMMRASELIGRDVKDGRDDEIGEIEDLVVNMKNGQVRYVVMEFDREWSPDDKLITLPLKAFTFPPDDEEELILNLPRDRIASAPGFEENNWPDLNASEFRRDNNDYLLSIFDIPDRIGIVREDSILVPSPNTAGASGAAGSAGVGEEARRPPER